jgi:predicted dehydrogenase
MSNKLKIGFVGVGGMGQAAHLQNYATLDDCEITAIAELRTDLGQKVARRWGAGDLPKVYDNHKEMLAAETLDGIVCVQPFDIHGSLLPDVLAKGLPVLTEKPIGRAVAVGEKLVAAARSSNAKFLVGYHKRSDLATLAVKAQIDQWKSSNALGKMRLVRVSMPPGDWIAAGFWQMLKSETPYPEIKKDAPEFAEPAASKKYEWFVNYYIHQVNLIRFLLGENYTVKFADPSACVLAGNSDSGVAVILEMASHNTTNDWQESALITFEHGWAKLDLPAPLTVNRAGEATFFEDIKGQTPRKWSPILPPVHAMRNQAIQFLKAIRGETTALCTPEHALADLKTARQYLDLLLQAK